MLMDNVINAAINTVDNVQISCGSSSATDSTVVHGDKCWCDELRSEMCSMNSIITQFRTKVYFPVSFLGLDDDQSNSSNIPNMSSVIEASTNSDTAAAISGAQNSTTSYVAAVRSKSTHLCSRMLQAAISLLYIEQHCKSARANNMIVSGVPR